MEIYKLGDEIPDEKSASRRGTANGESASQPGEYKITDLKPSLHDQNRVNVFINEKFDFSLDIAQVVELKVKVGRVLTPEELAEFRAAAEFGKLYQRALEWVLTRPRSRKEATDYLKRAQAKRRAENRIRVENAGRPREEKQQYKLKTKQLPEITDANIGLVLERLVERGYLDDAKFAKYYIENRFVKKGVSHRRLEQELTAKGVSTEDIERALAETPRDEAAEIRKIIAKKARHYTPEKLIQYITRQGFDYQLTQSLVREMDSQNWE